MISEIEKATAIGILTELLSQDTRELAVGDTICFELCRHSAVMEHYGLTEGHMSWLVAEDCLEVIEDCMCYGPRALEYFKLMMRL